MLSFCQGKKFGIEPSGHVKNREKDQKVIYIKKADVIKIKSNLIPNMHSSMN